MLYAELFHGKLRQFEVKFNVIIKSYSVGGTICLSLKYIVITRIVYLYNKCEHNGEQKLIITHLFNEDSMAKVVVRHSYCLLAISPFFTTNIIYYSACTSTSGWELNACIRRSHLCTFDANQIQSAELRLTVSHPLRLDWKFFFSSLRTVILVGGCTSCSE